MRGHVRKHGAGYQYTIELGKDPLTGKRKQKSKGGFKKEKEAEEAMAIEIAKIAKGEYFETENMTVFEYLKYWLETYAKVNVAPSTHKRYSEFSNTINKHLGSFLLGDLKPAHIQKVYSKLIASKALSNSTILKIHRMLRMALKHAVGWQILNNNPSDPVKPPKAENDEMHVWDIDTIYKFMDLIKDDVIYIPVLIAVQTGMRQGEICGLKWDDVDIEGGTLSVKHTMKRENGQLINKDTKTKKSKRNIALMEDTIAELKRLKVKQKRDKVLLGEEYMDEGYVCSWPNGSPVNPHYVCKKFASLVRKHKMPIIRFHDLRHTHATLLLQEKIQPKVVSERLGHSTIVVTMDKYSHVLPNMQKEAVSKLDIAFKKAR